MIKRNRVMALGGALAVAGCSAGGSTAAPVVKPAQTANRPLSTGHLTINATLLRHASSQLRRPSFLDPGTSSSFSGSLSLQITSATNDGSNLSPPVTNVPVTVGTSGPIPISVPLYGPGGTIRIQEIYQPTVAPSVVIADTDGGQLGTGNVQYSFAQGQDSQIGIFQGNSGGTIPITLNAVVGGVVISDVPDGSAAFPNTMFIPNGNPASLLYNINNNVEQSPFVYVFPADATGGFTNLSVPGGFQLPATLAPIQNFLNGFTITPAAVSGVFLVSGCSPSPVNFQATDVFGNTVSTRNAGTGYLQIQNDFC